MDIQPIFRCAVGIDIHLALLCVCIIIAEPGVEPVVHRREFGGFQRDRRAMADWIASFKPDIVVMESTGIYWKSPYAALEKVGIHAQVVNARQVKKVPGRKTDTSDAEWLAMLARAGLLRGSFIPPERLHTLRQVSRHHQKITAMRAMEKNRLVKVLSDAGVRITAVVSDPHGVAATAMINCLLDGGTPEQALSLAGRLQAPREELLAALQGELSADHRFVANTIRHHLQALEAQRADLERYLVEALQPHEAALQLLMTMPGIDRLAAAKLLVEIGVDMTAFGNAGRLCKWAGVCPGNDESAGKRRRGDTAPGNRYVRTLLCQIAWAAVRTTSQFKSRFQNLVSRRGTKKAIVAIGHKVLKTVFVLLSRQVPYHDSTVDYEALAVKRNAPRWIKQLRKFGYLPKMA
ncbi:IS110 family transposase [Candidatus Contendibacter odensensis]|uniref:Transposase n=1 Tax=Candidatus Contendobacter odensis Run_B_J11 TaxID=1400861 RepID=A0A7U7GAJ8_9GAMM|nr:IS110 family transposase [Candidatus Contendobacter odensis]CDH44600.1 transposase [Candidatus Contendobacter odensis Run_B_J11]